jgi:WD40 repeat protein/serine/threonine protein kinase
VAPAPMKCPKCSAPCAVEQPPRNAAGRCGQCGAPLGPNVEPEPPSVALVPLSVPDLSTPKTPPLSPTVLDAAPQGTQPLAAEVWHPGDVISGLYEIKQVHKSGGMGLVYRVYHRGWDMDLAVKSPRPEFVQNERAKVLFEREAETWVRLGLHPHIVTCYYVRRLDGIPRTFAEYINGGSLSDWIRDGRLYAGGAERSLERILDVAIQFARGLHYAHEQGLVHQDVKPANLLLSGRGIAKVTDFGLARVQAAVGEEPPGEVPRRLARQGLLVSVGGMTPAYCSPEQKRRLPVALQTDLWSWGVSLLEMFTGEVTWTDGQLALEALETFLELGPDDSRLPRMPAPVAALLRHVFRVPPEERPGSMLEVVEVLRTVYQQATGAAYPRRAPQPAEVQADSLNNRAVSLLDLGKPEEAEAIWQQALAVEPGHPEATYNRGLVLWRSGRCSEAELLQQVRGVCASHPGNWLPLYLLALVHLERNDCAAALQALRDIDDKDADRDEVQAAMQKVNSRFRSSLRPLRVLEDYANGHTSTVGTVCISRDGQYVLSGGRDGTLRLWELNTGRWLRNLEGHEGEVTSVCCDAAGRWVLSAGADQTLRLWDLSAGRCLRTFTGHQAKVTAACFHPASGQALSCGWDQTLKLWDLSTGGLLRTFEGAAGRVNAVCLSPDGRLALSGSGNIAAAEREGAVQLWQVSSGCCLRSFPGHRDRVTAVAVGPDGRQAISGSWDKTVRLWDLEAGRCVGVLEGHEDRVHTVCFGPEGRYAFSGSEDGTLRQWHVQRQRCVRVFDMHRLAVTSVAVSGDGCHAVTGNEDRTPRLWRLDPDLASPSIVCRVVDSARAQAATRTFQQALQRAQEALEEGDLVRAAGLVREARAQPGHGRRAEALRAWQELYLWLPRQTLNASWEGATLAGHRAGVTAAALSRDGCLAASGSRDRTVKLWDVNDGACLHTCKGHQETVCSVRFSRDGHYVLSASKDHTLRLWEVETGAFLQTFKGHKGAVRSACLTADNRFAVSAGWDRTLKLWETAGGRCLRTLHGHTAEVNSVCLSFDEQLLLSGGADRALRLWDMVTGRCLRTFDEQADILDSVCLTNDGRIALAGGGGSTFRAWAVGNGSCARTFKGHTARVSSVCLTADGRHALSASWDQTLRLWHVGSGRCLRVFEGHAGKVHAVCLSGDGRHALSAGEDRTLRLWVLDWELADRAPADWDEGAVPYLEAFLTLHTACAGEPPTIWPTNRTVARALTREGTPSWTKEDFQDLLYDLGCAGYGWLRPAGVRRELKGRANQ